MDEDGYLRTSAYWWAALQVLEGELADTPGSVPITRISALAPMGCQYAANCE